MNKPIVAFLILSSFLACKNNDSQNEAKPKNSTITESVYASVKVTPEVSYSAQTIRPGIIEKIFVKEGDLVSKGQVLFQIKPNSDINGQMANAKISLEEAKLNYLGQNSLLKNINLEIATTKQQLKLDSINFKRQERLNAQNIGTKLDFDQIKLKYENTKQQLALLNQKLKQSKNSLESNYKKALNASSTTFSELADYKIRSKIDGKVFSLNKEEGDFISAQEVFAEIGSSEQFKIEMDIDEVDITKIELGDSVLILLDAYVGEVFLAKVDKIFPKKNDISQTFRVESVFMQQPAKLYYGLSGEGNIVVSQRKNTLVIPTEYLLPNNKVLTADGEKSVTVGLKNLEFVEILSGIDTTTSLIKAKE
jgi:HlyD family secretion protein